MILPLVETLRLSLFNTVDGQSTFVGFANFQVLFGEERWAADFWRALKNNFIFFAIHMLVQNPLGIALAAHAVDPEAAARHLLSDGDFPADAVVLRHRRLHLEADPVADLGHHAVFHGPGRSKCLLRALARQARLGADRGVADLRLADISASR